MKRREVKSQSKEMIREEDETSPDEANQSSELTDSGAEGYGVEYREAVELEDNDEDHTKDSQDSQFEVKPAPRFMRGGAAEEMSDSEESGAVGSAISGSGVQKSFIASLNDDPSDSEVPSITGLQDYIDSQPKQYKSTNSLISASPLTHGHYDSSVCSDHTATSSVRLARGDAGEHHDHHRMKIPYSASPSPSPSPAPATGVPPVPNSDDETTYFLDSDHTPIFTPSREPSPEADPLKSAKWLAPPPLKRAGRLSAVPKRLTTPESPALTRAKPRSPAKVAPLRQSSLSRSTTPTPSENEEPPESPVLTRAQPKRGAAAKAHPPKAAAQKSKATMARKDFPPAPPTKFSPKWDTRKKGFGAKKVDTMESQNELKRRAEEDDSDKKWVGGTGRRKKPKIDLSDLSPVRPPKKRGNRSNS